MGTLKDRLTADMRTALKARDELTTSTLRMALAAVGNAEVAGKAKRELSDDEVLAVLTREAKKRREAATAFAEAGRGEQAAKETAEGEVLERYLPKQLSEEELAEVVAGALAAGGFAGKGQLGPAMKAAQAAVAGRAEGGRVAAEVRRQLAV
ncbi:GatB/YqeY domain-containing protein [Micromonospora sp. NPDC126480]|uniref:GatB/YqeY domain-containing protein n=1 Tax=Micromonospora sp. NPDC126480 TaxID=3155312 RepID=UPI0033253D0D